MKEEPKKRCRSAFEAPRADVFMLLPEQVTIVKDKAHYLYDPRVEAPLTKEFIADIEQRGVIQPIRVVREGGPGSTAFVVMGRRRVAAVAHINEKRRKEGASDEELLRIPTMVMRGTEDDLFAASIAENVHRRGDKPSELAAKAARLLNMNGATDKVAVCLAMSVAQARRLIKFSEMAVEVQRAVDARQIGLEAALQLADLSKEDQRKALTDLLKAAGEELSAEAPANAPTQAEPIKAAKSKAVKRTPVVTTRAAAKIPGAKARKFKMRSPKEVEERLATKNLAPDYKSALLWVLHREGEVPAAGTVEQRVIGGPR